MPATLDELPRMSDLTGSTDRFTRWLANFTSDITANPTNPIFAAAGGAGAAGPPATGLVLIAALNSQWQAAYALISSTATRTHATIVAARALRSNPGKLANVLGAIGPGVPGQSGGIVGALRSIIRKIQGAGTVTPDTLGAAGLCQHTKTRSLPQIPIAGPEIILDRSPPHTMVVRYRQEGMAESSKKKPNGCKQVVIRWRCDNGASGAGVFSKTPCSMDVGSQNTGQRITMQAAWVMGNSKESPPGNVIVGGVP